jgi:carboxypeptidase C (cathepsin A)
MRVVLALASAFVAFSCFADELDLSSLPVSTHHHGTFNGQPVDYTATVEVTTLYDASKKPTAKIVSTTYSRDGAADKRPVIFVFNGGPTAPSMMLQMLGLGPTHVVVTQDPKQPMPDPPQVADNGGTVLDVADLVFFDPVGTGFSRAMPDVDAAKLFYSSSGDADAAAQFVVNWVQDHRRVDAPKYVLGESYGTIRAALMAGVLAKTVPLDGVFLLGQAVNIVETSQRAKSVLGYTTNLPSLAVIAAYHGKAKLHGKSLAAFIDSTYTWAMSDYLSALMQGRQLSPASQRRVAQKLEELTGIPAKYYLEHDLAITKVDFTRKLLADEGLVVAQYDARYSGPAPKPGERGTDPFAKVNSAVLPAFNKQMTEVLQVKLPANEYRQFPGFDEWKYTPTGGAGGPFWDYDYEASLEKAFAAKPSFDLVIGTGVYDLTTTIGPARYLVSQSHYPLERVFLRQYEGGHMAYTNEPARKDFTDDVRAWVTDAAFAKTALSPSGRRAR